MSGKSARAARQALSQFKFPVLKTKVTVQGVTVPDPKDPFNALKSKYLPEKTYTVEADHGRRIRHLARSLGFKMVKAVEVYTKKMKMEAKPYFFDEEKRTYEMKQATA